MSTERLMNWRLFRHTHCSIFTNTSILLFDIIIVKAALFVGYVKIISGSFKKKHYEAAESNACKYNFIKHILVKCLFGWKKCKWRLWESVIVIFCCEICLFGSKKQVIFLKNRIFHLCLGDLVWKGIFMLFLCILNNIVDNVSIMLH